MQEALPSQEWASQFDPQVKSHLIDVEKRNTSYFEEESAKLDAWAEDLKISLERELQDVGRQIREAKQAKKSCATLQEKVEAEKAVRNLEAKRNRLRRELYEQQDQIDQQREALIAEIEDQLKSQHGLVDLFMFQWVIT